MNTEATSQEPDVAVCQRGICVTSFVWPGGEPGWVEAARSAGWRVLYRGRPGEEHLHQRNPRAWLVWCPACVAGELPKPVWDASCRSCGHRLTYTWDKATPPTEADAVAWKNQHTCGPDAQVCPPGRPFHFDAAAADYAAQAVMVPLNKMWRNR